MTLTIRYFAWMREHTGTDLETVPLPDAVSSVGDLAALAAMSDGHAQALKNMRAVRVAVNRTYGDLDTPSPPATSGFSAGDGADGGEGQTRISTSAWRAVRCKRKPSAASRCLSAPSAD